MNRLTTPAAALITALLVACSYSSSSTRSSSSVEGSGSAATPPARATWLAASPGPRWADDVRAGRLRRGMPRDVADAAKGLGPESFVEKTTEIDTRDGREVSRTEHYVWPDGTEAWIEDDEVVRVSD